MGSHVLIELWTTQHGPCMPLLGLIFGFGSVLDMSPNDETLGGEFVELRNRNGFAGEPN